LIFFGDEKQNNFKGKMLIVYLLSANRKPKEKIRTLNNLLLYVFSLLELWVVAKAEVII